MITSNFIRRMNFFQMIGAVITIYKRTFWPLTVISIINGLLTILALALAFIPPYVGAIIFIFVPVLYTGPILVAMSNTVVGKKVLIMESYRSGFSVGLFFKTALVALPACLLAIIISVATSIEYFYLFFLVFMPSWIFFPMVSYLEKLGFAKAYSRSNKLAFANFGRNILIILACLAFSIPFLLLGVALGSVLVGIIIAVPFVTMLAVSLFVMAYYETRARRENYNGDALSQELGFAPLDEMMSM